MSHLDNPSLLNLYQFSRWSPSINRAHTNLPAKNAHDMFKSGIDNRNHIENLSKKHTIRYNVHIPTELRSFSPPLLHQPTPTPDFGSIADHSSTISSNTPSYHITPIRIKSAALTIPIKTNSEELSYKNFPKQFYEKRKVTQDRKRQKQQADKSPPICSNNWFQLRQSLAELKRLATTEEILVDPSTSLFNCDGYSFEALKQAIHQQQEEKKINRFQSPSGMSSTMDSALTSNNRSRTSITSCSSALPRSRMQKQLTETYTRQVFEPLIVATKPLHPLLSTGKTHSLDVKNKKLKPPLSAPVHGRSPSSSTIISSFDDKRNQLLISDLSNNDDHPISSTPSLHLENVKEVEEEEEQQRQTGNTPRQPIFNNSKNPSTISLKSTIKIKPQTPRSRSAIDIKSSFSLNKTYPRFILITDQEHRIESWYHQYPFIVYDDLIQLFQSKSTQSTVSAYFTDNYQQIPSNSNKTILQGKPFYINSDWKKYDLILISNNIYQQIIIYLQSIIKLSGKIIHIHQINHHEDLKTQIRCIRRQLNQQILSHI